MEESLGNRLRAAREASGLTVDDAVYRAKLPRAVVEALEAEDFSVFTSPLYARSFLKQYGNYVGLDVSPWLDGLVPAAMIDAEAVDSLIELDEPDPLPAFRERKREKAEGGGGAWAAVWMLTITAGLLWGALELFREMETRQPPPVPPPVAEQPAPPPEEEEPAEEKPAIGGLEPPKRAIIVREE